MNKMTLAATLLLLAACSSTIEPYRWHRNGMGEREVNREKQACQMKAQQEAKKGLTPEPVDACMERIGFYKVY